MKKWTGGSVILTLAFLLLLRYTLFPLSTTATTTAAAVAASSPHRSHPPPPPPPFSPKPHLLPSLPSLDVLFPSPQLHSQSPTRPQLEARAHMQPLLRSDALPGTANGIREAAAAWSELLAALDAEAEEKAALSYDSNAEVERKSCPFIVNGSGDPMWVRAGLCSHCG